ELDSLVDVISFGVAPALLMYFLEFSGTGRFGWVICYIYVVATALRLARYNVLADTKPSSSWFTGIPSPAAGCTLAVYYPFSQTAWYRASLAVFDLQTQRLVPCVARVSRSPAPGPRRADPAAGGADGEQRQVSPLPRDRVPERPGGFGAPRPSRRAGRRPARAGALPLPLGPRLHVFRRRAG